MKTFITTETMEATKEWEDWDLECNRIDLECSKFNNVQIAREHLIDQANKLLTSLQGLGYDGFEVEEWINILPEPKDQKSSEDYYPPEPK